MAENSPAVIVNPTRSSKKKTFLDALKASLNDLYNKDATTNIHRVYDIIAEQLKDADIELKRALSDRWLGTTQSNERVTRSFSVYDRLEEEGAYQLNYIGFVPENTTAFQDVILEPNDEFIQLDRFPSSTQLSNFILTRSTGDNASILLSYYDDVTNRVYLSETQAIVGGSYSLSYTDKGNTLQRLEVVQLRRNENDQLQAVVAGSNLLYDSERITIHNSAIGTLTRDEDYTIDYEDGIVRATANGRIEFLEAEELDIEYSFGIDFETQVEHAFHKQVYNEAVRIVDPTTLTVNSNVVSEVFRVANVSKRQSYIPLAVSRDTISLQTEDELNVEVRTDQELNQIGTGFDLNKAIKTLSINIPKGEGRNSIQGVGDVIATSHRVRLIEGKRQNVPDQIRFVSFYEISQIKLTTGGIDAYRSNLILQENIDYTVSTEDPNTFVITLLETGINKIGTNSLYVQGETLVSAYAQTSVPSERRFQCKANLTPFSELYAVSGSSIILQGTNTYVDPGNNGDVRLKEEIVITNPRGDVVFVEDEDYTYDGINKTILLLTGSKIKNEAQIRVNYLGVQDFVGSYSTVPDILVADYDYTHNAIDWSNSMRTFNLRIRETLGPDKNLIRLAYHPEDPDDLLKIEVRSTSNPKETLRPISYDRGQRFLIVEAPIVEGDYIVSYKGHSHLVSPGIEYYVSYNYGGRDRALRDVWSPLLGLTETSRRRNEEVLLNGNDTSVVLDFPVVNIETIVIFEKGQTENEPATTITDYDPETNTIFFTSVRSYGAYIIAYDTPNALTEDLRKFVIGMMEAFLTGPTKEGIETMIETFTDITPLVRTAADLAFRLVDEKYNADPDLRSDRLNDAGFTAENPVFIPSRFNNGYQATVSDENVLYAPALTNVRASEGTIQLLIGPRFNGDDGLTRYLVDIGKRRQYYRNRIALYKNQRNYLVFETHDDDGQIWRVASNVGRGRTRLYRFLERGATSLELTARPAFATTDLDNDGQFDFFGAHKTEFIIRRVAGEESEDGTGYGYGYEYLGYGYRGAILRERYLQVNSPVNIAIHFQIPDKPEYRTVLGFDRVTRKLQALANKVKEQGGILVIHASVAYIDGNTEFSSVLLDLQQQGHEIGFYIDTPSFIITQAERLTYLTEGLALAKELGLRITSASANLEVKEYATYIKQLEIPNVSGYVDPFFGETFDDRSPIVRRTRSSETSGLLDLEAGELIYLPGTTYVDFSLPFTALTMQQVESTLHRALTMNDVNQVTNWYFTVTPDGLTENYSAETTTIANWINDTIKPLATQEKIRWSTFDQTGQLFTALEAWLNSLDAEERNIVDREISVKPLTYDFDTNTITFEPIPSDGIYEFDYVTGWAAYEESEIFVAAVYKFRTDDGSLPFYKLFINGELQEFVTFADFSAVEEE